MMLGGKDDVTAARPFGKPSPFAGETGFRLKEGNGAGGVCSGVGADALLDPLHAPFGGDRLAVPRSGESGVEAPVHEHAEASLTPPLHARVMLLRCFGGLGLRSPAVAQQKSGRGCG